MACFWNGILEAMLPEERLHFGPDAAGLQRFLVRHNHATPHCIWQGQALRPEELRDHVVWIRDDTTPVSHGHDTSTCDPYLCLVVELLGVDIHHDYNGHHIRYTFRRNPRTPVRTLKFRSDRGHFWAVR